MKDLQCNGSSPILLLAIVIHCNIRCIHQNRVENIFCFNPIASLVRSFIHSETDQIVHTKRKKKIGIEWWKICIIIQLQTPSFLVSFGVIDFLSKSNMNYYEGNVISHKRIIPEWIIMKNYWNEAKKEVNLKYFSSQMLGNVDRTPDWLVFVYFHFQQK